MGGVPSEGESPPPKEDDERAALAYLEKERFF